MAKAKKTPYAVASVKIHAELHEEVRDLANKEQRAVGVVVERLLRAGLDAVKRSTAVQNDDVGKTA